MGILRNAFVDKVATLVNISICAQREVLVIITINLVDNNNNNKAFFLSFIISKERTKEKQTVLSY